MSWVTVIWSMIATACLTLVAVHGLVWLQSRKAMGNLVCSGTALMVAMLAALEFVMMQTSAAGVYTVLLRWGHVPVFLLVVAVVLFMRIYLHAGRVWLAWTVVGVRLLSLAANFLTGENLNFRALTFTQPVPFLGETVFVPGGVANPWMLTGSFSVLLLVVFLVDATVTVWRRGERRRALTVGGSVTLSILLSGVNVILVVQNVYQLPILISPFYLGFIAAMSYELSRDLVSAAELAPRLLASETAFRESEQRVNLAAAAASLGLWTWDLVRDEIWANQKARHQFGVEATEQVDFNRFLQTLHPDDRESVTHAVAKAMNGEGEYEAEYRVEIPGQAIRWLAARGRMEFDAQRKPVSLRGVSIDLTDRKLAEDKLRESEARFRIVADAAPVLIWMSGPDKLCTFFNAPWLDFTGRSLEQELGNGWAIGVHGDDLQRCLKTYEEAFDARRNFEMEYRLRRHDGEYRWISDSGVPRYDAHGNFSGYIGACADVTERKRAEEKFRLAVEASPSALIMVDHQGNIQLINVLTEKLFGYVRSELIGSPVEVLVPERYRSAHPSHRSGFMGAPQARAMGAGRELFARRKDGSEFPVEIGLNPIRTSEGVLVLCAIVDITERRRAEVEMQTLRQELAHSARVTLMGELSASMAHELNQPLTAILSNAQAAQRFLAADPPDLAEFRDILKDIVQDTTRARDVIRQLRSLVKKGDRESIRLDLHETIKQVVNFLHGDIVGRNVTVTLDLGIAPPVVTGDKTQVQQVLINLLLNACDAMSHNSFPDRRVTVRTALESPELVRVTVRDSGVGIPVEQMEAIFQPFFTTKAHGLGMGLSLSRSIVESHGGRLWAENNASGGASFCFTLPATRET